jgi:RNA polymerase sigma factor (sigma-70 family)
MPQAPATRPSLLVRLRDGRDQQAWFQFVDLYAPLVYGYARRHHLQDADAADLVQIVLRVVVSAVRKLEYDPARGSFRGWLFTIVRTQLANAQRRKHDYGKGTGASSTQHFLEQLPAPEADASTWDVEYHRRLFTWSAEQVRPHVRTTTWQAFWQTAVVGKSAREVASQLGLTVAAVHLAKSRVMSRIKAALRDTRDSDLLTKTPHSDA